VITVRKIGALIAVSAVALAAELAVSPDDEGMPTRPKRDPSQVELELKLARADLQLTRQGADLDEKRRVFAEILAQHHSARAADEVRHETSGEWAKVQPHELPIPLRQGMSAEDFHEKGRDYLSKLKLTCSAGLADAKDPGDALDDARRRYHEMIESPQVRDFVKEMETAGAEIRQEAFAAAEQASLEPGGGMAEEQEAVGVEADLKRRIDAVFEKAARELEAEGLEDDLDQRRLKYAEAYEFLKQERLKITVEIPSVEERLVKRIHELEAEIETTK
jgi:hypothetical protein